MTLRTRLPRTTTLAIAIAIAIAAVACAPSPDIERRPVVIHSPRACPVSDEDAYSVLYAAGDFEPSGDRPPTASVFLRDVGRTLGGLPGDTRSLVVDVSDREGAWRGLTEVARSGPIDVLVWPARAPCRLTGDVERRAGATFGAFGRHVMIAGGRSIDGAAVPRTYVGDLATGILAPLAFGLNTRRSDATITELRGPGDPENASSALVAGGHDPDSGEGGAPVRALATAEVYVPRRGAPGELGDFEQHRVDLSEPRTRHGAVVLATGETLLVGGRGAAGVLRTMEVVDPATRRARTSGVALLRVARERPTVLRLANGEILVAGGVDASGNEIPTLEWFSPDASRATKRPVDLVTGRQRAFVALAAGGALAVVRPPEGATDQFKTVWVVSADGTLEPGTPVPPDALDDARLFGGAEGAPLLWTGQRWLRWSPWAGAFEPMADARPPSAGASQGPALDAIASGDPGLALWLAERDGALEVNGLRFATRSRFEAVPKPLLASGIERFAPDRLASKPDATVRYEPERGLVLGSGASAFLTDVTFADFELQLDVTGVAPMIVVRSPRAEMEIGGAACALGQGAQRSLEVRRSGARVTVRVDGGSERTCPATLDGGARVSLGLRGTQAAGASAARNLRVYRR